MSQSTFLGAWRALIRTANADACGCLVAFLPPPLPQTCVDGLALARFNELSVMYGISGGSGPCHVRREDVANESAGM